MTDTKPEALRLAEEVGFISLGGLAGWRCHSNQIESLVELAAAELRRLHEVNAELLEALKRLVAYKNGAEDMFFAKAAISKAEGESK